MPNARRTSQQTAPARLDAARAASITPAKLVRLLVVGNHPLMRSGIESHLRHERGTSVVGVVASVDTALAECEEDPPDVALVLLPGMDGIEATRQLTARWTSVAVIVLSVDSRAALVLDALRAGATGYLTADCSVQLLSQAIQVAAAGGMLLASHPVLHAFRRLGIVGGCDGRMRPVQSPRSSSGAGLELTTREMEVLQLIADGYSNKEISARLHLAIVTVKKYVQSVAGKLGVSDRTQAAVRGVREGLVR